MKFYETASDVSANGCNAVERSKWATDYNLPEDYTKPPYEVWQDALSDRETEARQLLHPTESVSSLSLAQASRPLSAELGSLVSQKYSAEYGS